MSAQPALVAFQHARQAMLAAFAAWLRERPACADVADEVEGLASALRQLAALEWIGR